MIENTLTKVYSEGFTQEPQSMGAGNASTSSLPDVMQLPGPLKRRQSSLPHNKGVKVSLSPVAVCDLDKDDVIIDLRCAEKYKERHLVGSWNVCVPTTLLKRATYTIQRIIELIPKESRDEFNDKLSRGRLIMYDGSSPVETQSMTVLAQKFGGKAFYIKGGYEWIEEHEPGLLINETTPRDEGLVGGCSMPQGSTPFFGQIRQAMELSHGPPVTGHPLHLPEEYTADLLLRLPKWLQKVIGDVEGLDLARKFYSLEKAELNRLMASLNAGSDAGDYGVSAGIELGERNRYKFILPYEHTRVKIQEEEYVNASHMTLPFSEKRYIATQAPLPATFIDFFTMMWEQNVSVIVTLTTEMDQGQVKCHVYWDNAIYGPFSVESTVVKETESDVTRMLWISKGGEKRKVTQIQYTQWPDFSPAEPPMLLDLVQTVDSLYTGSPIIVHCSAGCGRTGVFCATSYLIDYLFEDGVIKENRLPEDRDIVYDIVSRLRKQRVSMVQTLPQFVLCYEVVLLNYVKIFMGDNIPRSNSLVASHIAGEDMDLDD